MREIKFRAWDKKQNKMKQLESMNCDVWFNRGGLNVGENIEYGTHDEFNFFELMQFTGLKDKNGKGIYEGDILNDPFTDIKATVKFLDGAFCVIGYEKFAVDLLEYLEGTSSGTCIIGNIYELKED